MAEAPSSARVLIIGGGIGGVSVAYHLATLGMDDIVLLERATLSAGTTWHSTGNMETYRADPLIFAMVRYAADLYPRIAADSARDIGWRVVGRVMYTDREERWEHMRALPELGPARGIEIDLLAPKDIERRLPIIAADELIGGLWIPSDARVNPTDAVSAFAQLARARGVGIREHCAVLGVSVRNNAVCGVTTADGEIECASVVITGGLWSGDIAQTAGVRLPLHALEHQYLITRPFGVDRNLPLFLSFDDQLYGREEVGGLIIGSLDDGAIPIATSELPEDFASCLLSERWEQFEPYMATAMRRFPALAGTAVKMLLNGPESFTPDGQMLLGPVPGVSGLYACCGFNSNGMALAPAAGRYLAEWLVEGSPSADVAPLDVRRFSAVQSDPRYLRERVTEIPGYHCRMHSPDDDYRTARGVRLLPLHRQHVADGAVFTSMNGWERPAWFKRGTRTAWLDAVCEETRAAAAGCLLIDRSSDVKYLIEGAAAQEWLEQCAPPVFAVGETQVLLAAVRSERDEVEALVRVLEATHDRCVLAASADQETRVGEWLRRKLPPRLRASDQTHELACLELRGPCRNALLERVMHGQWSSPILAREDPLHDSTLIMCVQDVAQSVWRDLRELGAQFGLVTGGHLAEQAIRIERGVPAFGREISSANCLSEIRTSRGGRRILAFATAIPRLGLFSGDVILQGGRAVGELTSRMRIPGWESTLALGRLELDCPPFSRFETVVDGKTWPLVQRDGAWQDALRRSGQ